MKKVTTFLLISACSLTFISNSFGMLTRKIITHTTQVRPLCTNKIIGQSVSSMDQITFHTANTKASNLEVQLIKNRHQIKNDNNILVYCATEQNKIIDQLDQFDKPMTEFEYFLSANKITDLAQQLLNWEKAIQESKQKGR